MMQTDTSVLKHFIVTIVNKTPSKHLYISNYFELQYPLYKCMCIDALMSLYKDVQYVQ